MPCVQKARTSSSARGFERTRGQRAGFSKRPDPATLGSPLELGQNPAIGLAIADFVGTVLPVQAADSRIWIERLPLDLIEQIEVSRPQVDRAARDDADRPPLLFAQLHIRERIKKDVADIARG